MIELTTLPTIIASEAAQNSGSGSVLQTLGLDVKLLVFQIIAFGILVGALAKWVFPPLIKTLNERQENIQRSLDAAKEAEAQASKAEASIDKLLKDARSEASDIVSTAKAEASNMVAQAEEKSKTQAEHIVAEAHDSIAKEIIAARRALHNETIDLIAAATEKVVGKTVDAKADKTLISSALKDVR